MRSVNFARKQNEAEFLDVIVNFSSQITSVSPARVARKTMKMRPFFVRYWKRVGANCHQSVRILRPISGRLIRSRSLTRDSAKTYEISVPDQGAGRIELDDKVATIGVATGHDVGERHGMLARAEIDRTGVVPWQSPPPGAPKRTGTVLEPVAQCAG
ncbi:MAG TPA: hypothetical protein VG055_11960 [Planctomycetaceae bacterium]|jgi:hypothetical protein|nr:hypothetical protein [Planctomycetaceae bacterium]